MIAFYGRALRREGKGRGGKRDVVVGLEGQGGSGECGLRGAVGGVVSDMTMSWMWMWYVGWMD